VWACSSPGGLIHYDGNKWSDFFEPVISGYEHPGFGDVWGDSPNNIYAVGSVDYPGGLNYIGIIYHYDGNKWERINIPDIKVRFYNVRRGAVESDKYYISGTRFESTGDTGKIYEFDGQNLKEIYQGTIVNMANEMAGKMYFTIGKFIYKYQNGKLILWKDFSATDQAGKVWGRSEKDFFTEGYHGLMHYNGTDLQTIYTTDLGVYDAMVFPDEIFFVGKTGMTPVIVHGKLK